MKAKQVWAVPNPSGLHDRPSGKKARCSASLPSGEAFTQSAEALPITCSANARMLEWRARRTRDLFRRRAVLQSIAWELLSIRYAGRERQPSFQRLLGTRQRCDGVSLGYSRRDVDVPETLRSMSCSPFSSSPSCGSAGRRFRLHCSTVLQPRAQRPPDLLRERHAVALAQASHRLECVVVGPNVRTFSRGVLVMRRY